MELLGCANHPSSRLVAPSIVIMSPSFSMLVAVRALLLVSAGFFAIWPPALRANGLDSILDPIAPEIRKWATVCVVERSGAGTLEFTWHDYRETGSARDFWPASTIKLYAAIAALELLFEHDFPLDTLVAFERCEPGGEWNLDCARTVREMLSEVFRRSSNEDYTLLLRLVGIDRVNTSFLVPAKGFPHSALMRGYVLGRPYEYVRSEAQRITLRTREGRTATLEHRWSGRSYSAERGASVIDAQTGNVTSPRELVECLRRILFHEELPPEQRFQISADHLAFLRHGGNGWYGLENIHPASDPIAWKNGVETVFPMARYYHKNGVISNFALEVAAVDDRKNSGKYLLFVPVIAAGSASKPESGQKIIGKMGGAIAEWVRGQ